ncbi:MULTISPECIES: DUF4145 domain-containing protein [Curtobacterium]|uniref:DUF4145 domain-containing protein n=1 Tax=Curtobacterium TaxID=2034 RepID=UPI00217D87E1|nr:DUF4145 domain-containing protein [Curtobacterium flaccumfaciens]MCS6562424.1 hypothetical protein [Curtobacterium flaccumfaciens pv. poinsettiae]UXN28485.1 hypothetical protein N8D75_16040 [Curtobacterium flaccumfaciens]
MATKFSDLYVVGSGYYGTFSTVEDVAWKVHPCPRCGGSQMIVIAYAHGGGASWLRCANCGFGVVRNSYAFSPSTPPLRTPDGLPELEREAWAEVRNTLAVGANTAAVMLCRKMILHVAIAAGLTATAPNGQGPSFGRSVGFLQDEGFITPPLRTWVDRIRDVGNEANHELPGIEASVALDVAEFTLQLLVLMYELPDRMKAATPNAPTAQSSGS